MSRRRWIPEEDVIAVLGEDSIPIPPKAKRTRRNETRDLTTPIRVALNKLPGVRVVRNTDRGVMVPLSMIHLPNPPKILTGLGEGGADLVGICSVRVALAECQDPACDMGHAVQGTERSIGRAFALEVKWPDFRAKADKAHRRRFKLQELWRQAFRDFGGFACIVTSVEDAMAAVERCRRGESQ